MRLDRLSDHDLLHGRDPRGERFATFYERHATWMLRQLARRGVDAATAADVLAETFMTALVHRRAFDEARGSARAWLGGIMGHKLAEDHRRSGRVQRLARRLQVELPAVSERDADAYDALARHLARDQVDDERLREAVDGLSPAQQRAVTSRVIHDRSYAEVAAALQTNETAARKHVSRGLSALRRRLAD